MSPQEHQIIVTALTAARNDGASLDQLMTAHQLSERYQAAHTTAELRQHIREMIPNKRLHLRIGYDITLGIITGIITHHLLQRYAK